MKPAIRTGVVIVILCGLIFAGIFLLDSSSKKDEQVVFLRLQSFALSLNPLKMADVESRQVATLLYTGLVSLEQGGKVVPALAKSWERKENTWTFTLRDGMTFSNGQPVTPSDVKESLCNAMQPSSPWAWSLLSIAHKDSADGKYRKCSGIVVSGNEIIITESKPTPWLLDALSGPGGWILPARYEEGVYGVVPGTGPFKVKEIVADSKVVLEARAEGSAIMPGISVVQFNYLPDDTTAASEYVAGKLHVLDLTSPQLVELMTTAGSSKLNYAGRLLERDWDRVRVVIVNEKALYQKGFEKTQIRDFIERFNILVNREKISQLSKGIGSPLYTPFPPFKWDGSTDAANLSDFDSPKAKMTILTEADPYSDLIAASLPQKIGNVSINYRGVDKGILMGALLKGESELVSMLIESTVHSPLFWKAFFTPGNPFSVAGKALPGLEKLDMTSEADIVTAGRRIVAEGNWVMLMQEKRLQAVAPGIEGITYSPSGQTNYSQITIR